MLIGEKSELLSCLDSGLAGRLANPSDPNHVALGIALGRLCGAEVDDLVDDADASVVQQIESTIGESDHLVFVMLDGFGMNFVDTLPSSSFVRRRNALELSAVFPTSTAPNLMSLATGRWPGGHGNLAWHVYIPRLGERITSLLWQRTSDRRDLREVGMSPSELLTAPLIRFGSQRHYVHLTESGLAGSAWTRMMSQDETEGYDHGAGAIASVVDKVQDVLEMASGPTFTYVYWPDVDHAAHSNGVAHPVTRLAVSGANSLVEALGTEFAGRAKVVATADHGHLDVGDDGFEVVSGDDDLLSMLSNLPSGEQRMLFFHVRLGHEERFAELFMSRFGDKFALMSSSDALDWGLLGPASTVSLAVRDRVGEFLAISRGRWALEFPDDAENPSLQVSTHGGITELETRVPLVVCN